MSFDSGGLDYQLQTLRKPFPAWFPLVSELVSIKPEPSQLALLAVRFAPRTLTFPSQTCLFHLFLGCFWLSFRAIQDPSMAHSYPTHALFRHPVSYLLLLVCFPGHCCSGALPKPAYQPPFFARFLAGFELYFKVV
jgi:hypothetical protein